ncbi:hypothetical protein DQ04_01611070 [Trypanosoma grayi]|uniref:hypothetical protein n=1 Tax=Trypanosoma grayi TaxID=71804 RepID=UPI0004F498E0|nr:hypothetical protein DQ04_01611070 [Trypanosoma grayi]KEG12565.1 hypothetical protein DQ04_01611070 [Trypanosoma grayi]
MPRQSLDVFASTEQLEEQRKLAQRRIFLITLVVFSVVAGGSFACVFFGLSEIVNHDTILMNDGLGEVMTILGICFTLPCLFCLAAFVVLALGLSCARISPHCSIRVSNGLNVLSFVLQQVVTDVYLFSFSGPAAAAAVVADVCVLGCYAYSRFQHLYVPTSLGVLLFVGKMTALWALAQKISADDGELGPNGVRAVLFLTIPIVQIPLYVAVPREQSAVEYAPPSRDVIVENFTNNFNLLLLHLLNSLDIVTMYTSFVAPERELTAFAPTPEPFRCLIIIIVSVAFVGNNIGVIHLFYTREGVEHAELKCLPKKFRDATAHWSSTDMGGSHKRRILQYMLLLLVVCDVPLLAVRMQLWWRGHQMLSVFVTKNIKSILDAVMVVLRVDRSGECTDRSRYLLSEGG